MLPVLLIVLAGPAPSSARPLVQPAPSGSDWGATAVSLRTQPGSRFVYICPAGGSRGQLWGTDVYTDDSSVCTAAVHKGVITIADGGTVTIEHLPGQESYAGSTKNGVTSGNWAAYSGSFSIVGADAGGGAAGVKMGGGSWTATATTYRGKNGERYRYLCPGGGKPGTVYGTNTYTDDSSVCTAAVHVGLFTPADGGLATIEIRPGEASYASFTANGVTTRSYGSWVGSFVFAGAPAIPGSGGPSSPGTAAPATATTTGAVTVNGTPFTSGTVPYNATVDVTKGTLELKTDTGSLKVNGEGAAPAAFKLVRGLDNKKPIVELVLAKGDFSACPKRKTKSGRLAAAGKAPVRALWGNGKGSFRTKGRYAAATVRGTNWLVEDTCDGTLTKVKRGVVQVTDLVKKKQVTIRAGQSYLAKP